MKYLLLSALLPAVVLLGACGQDKTERSAGPPAFLIRDTTTARVPNGMVRNVRQDRNGDVLVASYRGVFRYDGKSFTNLTGAIPSPSFWDVLEDRNGHLWFGSRDSGVYRYDGTSWHHFTTRQGLASNYGATHLFEDRAGTIWVGTAGGLSRFDGNAFRSFTTKDGLPHNDINAIMEDRTGKVWVGTRGDAFVYDGKAFTTLTHKGNAFPNIWGLTEDKKGNIWLGGGDALWRYDGSTFTKAAQKGAYAMITDKAGNIWTTGADQPPRVGQNWSLSRYDQKSLYDPAPVVTEIFSKPGLPLCGILEANDGSIWFGSMNGVFRYDGKTITDFKSRKEQ